MIGPARYWRAIPQRYRREAARCAACGALSFPPRLVCRACGGREAETVRLSDQGEILAFSVVRAAPEGFGEEVPYALGLVRLDDGAQMTAQIVDCDLDALAIGDRVRLEFRRIREEGPAGILCYGHKFAPDQEG